VTVEVFGSLSERMDHTEDLESMEAGVRVRLLPVLSEFRTGFDRADRLLRCLADAAISQAPTLAWL
jgi:hypothetical protein